MTTHYCDIVVLPDPEVIVPHLLGALYDKLHRALARQQIDSVGVSFPKYSTVPRQLGDTLRLHGSEATLRTFLQLDWLRALRDHVRVSEVAAAPSGAPHRSVSRRQFKSSVDRLRRRRMKRKGETAQQAAQAVPASAAQKPNLPYVHLHSLSTLQPFCLFIAMSEPQAHAVVGTFNSYGLGEHGATIPWF